MQTAANRNDFQHESWNSHTLLAVTSHRIILSTSSVYPMRLVDAFSIESQIGCDGIEIMVSSAAETQSASEILKLSESFGVAVSAIHHPCLLSTTNVWGSDPSKKLIKSVELATELGASTVVTHPTFVWQRDFAKRLLGQIENLNSNNEVQIALENMYPLRTRGRSISAYSPSWDIRQMKTEHVVFDTSHASVAQLDILEQWRELAPQVRHLHLSDATGRAIDEHLLPGSGNLPLGLLLNQVADHPTAIDVVVEVNTSGLRTFESRLTALRGAVDYVRAGLSASA